MKFVKQFLTILIFSFLGEVLRYVLPFPVPASIYGLVLLFLALECKVIALDRVKDTGKFLIEIMSLLFIPAGAGLINSWGALKPIFVPVVCIMFFSTIIVMVISGRVTQSVIRKGRKRDE